MMGIFSRGNEWHADPSLARDVGLIIGQRGNDGGQALAGAVYGAVLVGWPFAPEHCEAELECCQFPACEPHRPVEVPGADGDVFGLDGNGDTLDKAAWVVEALRQRLK